MIQKAVDDQKQIEDTVRFEVKVKSNLDMPTRAQFEETNSFEKVFRQEDPSKFYEAVEMIGKGANSKIFKVKRLADNKMCALKFF